MAHTTPGQHAFTVRTLTQFLNGLHDPDLPVHALCCTSPEGGHQIGDMWREIVNGTPTRIVLDCEWADDEHPGAR